MSTVTDEVRTLAEVLWNYHRLDPALSTSDMLLVLGSHDIRVAEHAAAMWHEGWAPLLVISGGRGKITEAWARSEAEVFADVAARHGVAHSAMILEQTAANTGDNIACSRALLEQKRIPVRSGILVAKPYMARRALATAGKQWPGVRWLVSTPAGSLADYTARDTSERQTIELMVGDLQRIKVYAERGFQTPMTIPEPVWDAYERLVVLGFHRYVL